MTEKSQLGLKKVGKWRATAAELNIIQIKECVFSACHHPFFRLARDPTTAATAALADPYLGQSIGPVPGYGVSLDPLICHLTPQSIISLFITPSLLSLSRGSVDSIIFQSLCLHSTRHWCQTSIEISHYNFC